MLPGIGIVPAMLARGASGFSPVGGTGLYSGSGAQTIALPEGTQPGDLAIFTQWRSGFPKPTLIDMPGWTLIDNWEPTTTNRTVLWAKIVASADLAATWDTGSEQQSNAMFAVRPPVALAGFFASGVQRSYGSGSVALSPVTIPAGSPPLLKVGIVNHASFAVELGYSDPDGWVEISGRTISGLGDYQKLGFKAQSESDAAETVSLASVNANSIATLHGFNLGYY